MTAINDLDSGNIEVYGADEDLVSVAPFGTTLPVGMAALAAPFVDLGWLSEDGVDWEDSISTKEFKGHQGGRTVLTVIEAVDRKFKVQLLEETAKTLGLRYPGWEPTAIPGTGGEPTVYGGEVPAPKTDYRVFVIDLHSIANPGHDKRYVIPKGQVVGTGTVVHKRADMTILEYEVSVAEGKFFLYYSNPAFAE